MRLCIFLFIKFQTACWSEVKDTAKLRRYRRETFLRMPRIKLYINIRMRIHLHEAQQISREKQRGNVCNMQIRHTDRSLSYAMAKRYPAGLIYIYFFFKSIPITPRHRTARTILDFHEEMMLKDRERWGSLSAEESGKKKLFTSWILYRAISYPLFPQTRGRISRRRRARLEVRTGIWSKLVTLRAAFRPDIIRLRVPNLSVKTDFPSLSKPLQSVRYRDEIIRSVELSI